jgi:hypothetical protein
MVAATALRPRRVNMFIDVIPQESHAYLTIAPP